MSKSLLYSAIETISENKLDKEFSVFLGPDREAHDVVFDNTTPVGEALMVLNKNKSELIFWVRTVGLSGPVTGAHFHSGSPNEEGPIIHDITRLVREKKESIGLVVRISGSWSLDNNILQQMDQGNIFLNIHTEKNPTGEIRGNIQPLDLENKKFKFRSNSERDIWLSKIFENPKNKKSTKQQKKNRKSTYI